MLIIRKEQMAAFQKARDESRIETLRDRVISRLQAGGYLLNTDNQIEEDNAAKDNITIEMEPAIPVEEQITAYIRQGMDYGIRSESGLTQFVGYSYIFTPEWITDKTIRSILENAGVSEVDKLNAVHKVLSAM